MRGSIQKVTWIVVLALSAGLMLVGVASAGAPQAKTKAKQKQQPAQPAQTEQPADQAQPADQQQQQQPSTPPGGGLLKKSVTASSSKQGKETASAGFNGVGPDGKVKEALLNANPSADAKAKAAQLSLVEADAADLQAFAKEGKLMLPAKSADKKGK